MWIIRKKCSGAAIKPVHRLKLQTESGERCQLMYERMNASAGHRVFERGISGTALVLFALLIVCKGATGEIYKCEDQDGNPVYSQTKCAENAEEVEIEDTAGLAADPTLVERQRGKTQQIIRSQRQDSRARILMTRIARHKREKARCERDMKFAADNIAGATWLQSLQECVSREQQQIATLQNQLFELQAADDSVEPNQ